MKNKYVKKCLCALIAPLMICLYVACNSEEADIERGHRYINRKNYDRAIQNYSFAIKTNPSNPNAYYYRGLARMKAGDLDTSIDDFTMAIKLDPNYFEAYINRGANLITMGKLDEALIDYNKAIGLKPDDLKALLVRADIWFKKKFYDKAIADYDVVIENDPKASIAYRGRGDAYYRKNDYQESIKDYLKTIDLNPKDSFAYNNLAWIFSTCADVKFRDGEKALQYSQKAVELDPSPYNLSTLAAAYAENDKFGKAVKILKGLIDNEKESNGLKEKLESYLILFQSNQPLREEGRQLGGNCAGREWGRL